jgi:uncharacterized protein YpmS
MDRSGWNWLVLLMLALVVLLVVVAIFCGGPLKKWASAFG